MPRLAPPPDSCPFLAAGARVKSASSSRSDPSSGLEAHGRGKRTGQQGDGETPHTPANLTHRCVLMLIAKGAGEPGVFGHVRAGHGVMPTVTLAG